jgi:carbon starvation protein
MNDRIDAAMCAIFMAVVVATAIFGVRSILKALRSPGRTAREYGLEGFEVA